MNEQSETSVLKQIWWRVRPFFGQRFFSLWKGSCAVNNLKGRLFCFEFVFCIEFEDEVHADDSEGPYEIKGKS